MLFPLGRLLATPGALNAIAQAGQTLETFFHRHQAGGWGDVDKEDQAANQRALIQGTRLLSAYKTHQGTRLWIITEADRSATTILLPEEY